MRNIIIASVALALAGCGDNAKRTNYDDPSSSTDGPYDLQPSCEPDAGASPEDCEGEDL